MVNQNGRWVELDGPGARLGGAYNKVDQMQDANASVSANHERVHFFNRSNEVHTVPKAHGCASLFSSSL